MKKILFFAAFAVFGLLSVNAQETNFGLKAGADFASIKAKVAGISGSASETGFYVGGFAEIGVSESFILQPEVLYVSINNFDQVAIPLMGKLAVSEKLNALVGPSFGILLDAGEGVKSLNLGIEGGVAYDFSEQFFVEARYNIGLSNLLEDGGTEDLGLGDISTKLSGIFIGIGYRL